MVHQVLLFITKGFIGQIGAHMGIAIKCEDGWYCFEYASGGASGSSGSYSSASTSKVTVKKYNPPGQTKHIGDTTKGLQSIIDYARNQSDFHDSKYDITENNCRQFARELAEYMGVSKGFDQVAKWYTCTKK